MGRQAYRRMVPVLRDVEAFRRGEYSLFTPLPESVLEAERQAKQAAREARKAEREAQKAEQTQRILQAQREVPEEPEGKLAAAARALGKKMQPQATELVYKLQSDSLSGDTAARILVISWDSPDIFSEPSASSAAKIRLTATSISGPRDFVRLGSAW